jgi:diaminopimelate decarboxylase
VRHFDYVEDVLFAEGISLEQIAEQVQTPCFVYARATIERHFRVYDEAFGSHPHLVCYSVKANSTGAVLSVLQRMGAGADIVSGGELVRAQKAGIEARNIVFSGVGKTQTEMAEALDAGILAFNVESEAELMALAEVARGRNKEAPVALRVNPDVDPQTHPYIATGMANSKFGVPIDHAPRIADAIVKTSGLKLVGLDCHIGSQLTSLEPLMEALESVLELTDTLNANGHKIQSIDLGGGLGIPYKGEVPPHPREFGQAVVDKMKGRSERVILEPGRVIVGNAGLLLSRVLYRKQTPTKKFVIIDAGMNDLIRPSLYEAFHDVWPVRRDANAEQEEVDVVGPICESTDVFARARTVPKVKRGDLIAIMSSGAYGFTMASTYNSRPLCAEVMVSKDAYHVVRARGDYASLTAREHIPDWGDEK